MESEKGRGSRPEHIPDKAKKRPRNPELGSTALYTSKILKGGALLPDTKALFAAWDPSMSIEDNLQQVRLHNILGKASRSRVEDILIVFQQRYLNEAHLPNALARLVQRKSSNNILDRIFYFHAVRADILLRNIVLEVLLPRWSQGILEVDIKYIESILRSWVEQGKTVGHWREITVTRIAQSALSTLRDFGLLQGKVHKRMVPFFLPIQAFAYIAFYLKQQQPSGAKLLEHPDWRLFFLSHEHIEHFFLEAHQRGLLEYHVAGSVTRLSFPVETLEEYADVLTQ